MIAQGMSNRGSGLYWVGLALPGLCRNRRNGVAQKPQQPFVAERPAGGR